MAEGRYSRIKSRYWTDEVTGNWSNDTKLLGLYLMTSPHNNMIGCFVLPKSYICEDLKWTSEQLAKPFAQLLAEGFIKYDDTVRVILIVRHLIHNPIENLNQAKAAAKVVAELPKSALLSDLKLLVEQLGKPFLEPLVEQLTKRLGKPVTVSVTVSGTVGEGERAREETPTTPIVEKLISKASEIKGWAFSEEEDAEFFPRLLADYPEDLVEKVIEDLRTYQEKPDKHYSNLHSTLRNWCKQEARWREERGDNGQAGMGAPVDDVPLDSNGNPMIRIGEQWITRKEFDRLLGDGKLTRVGGKWRRKGEVKVEQEAT